MIKPLRNNVLIQRVKKSMETASGIVLTVSEEADRAQVLAIGPLVDEVAVGDEVLANWNKATNAGDSTFIVPITEIPFVFDK